MEIPFREVGADGELVRIYKTASIPKPSPPHPPTLSSLPEKYK